MPQLRFPPEARITIPSPPDAAAPVISALNIRPGVDPAELQGYLIRHGLMISGGLGELKGKIIRVGHMGHAKEPAVVEALLEAVGAFLKEKAG